MHYPFSLVFLDYTSTWRGNASTNPRKDVQYALDYLKFTRQAVLAVTFCTRTRIRKNRCLEDVDDAKAYIHFVLMQKGRNVISMETVKYGTIVTLIAVF